MSLSQWGPTLNELLQRTILPSSQNVKPNPKACFNLLVVRFPILLESIHVLYVPQPLYTNLRRVLGGRDRKQCVNRLTKLLGRRMGHAAQRARYGYFRSASPPNPFTFSASPAKSFNEAEGLVGSIWFTK
jgi:hypothetical protein